MAKTQRLFDFKPGERIYSSQVDDEFNNLVDAHNNQDDEINTHNARVDNPHQVTATQIGAYTKLEIDNINEVHKNSSDHDARYFTKEQLNIGQLDSRYYPKNLLDEGKLDVRYFTKDELSDGLLDNRYFTKAQLSNGQLDGRYYTKGQLDASMRNGDTVIKYEVFTIVSSNNGDGTFTYKNDLGEEIIGSLTAEGNQTFTLQKGFYHVGHNRLEAIVSDTLHRSAGSGGLIEVDETHVILTEPEGNEAEITFKYFESIGLTGEHKLSHEDGGTDEIKGILVVSTTEPHQKFAGKIWGKVL